ncbi:hypothetical protein ONS96_000803 [Cadophora gregata f. sp. sojae]|nr:hypothetical protein ONS96_000803 [Cadophora gregata f. sp. sojae]
MSSKTATDILAALPLPSIDRPFGVHLWPIFDKAFSAIKGYSPQDFDFQPRVTPMSTLKESGFAILAYYIIILGGRELMRNRPAFKLNTLFMIHNFYLTSISAILLALFLEQLIPTLYNHGLFFTICEKAGGWTPQLVILYYLNYLTKYLELIDTVFLVLKKKPLTFLHCYHHGATALLCYTQLIGLTSVSWTVISLNLFVHVVMYWYYFQSARGIKIWWKEWITRLQITQFVIALGKTLFQFLQLSAIDLIPRIRLLCILHLLHLDILPMDAKCGQLRWRGVRRFLWHCCHQLLPRPLHLFLLRNLQEGWQAPNRPQGCPLPQGCRDPRRRSPYPRQDHPRIAKWQRQIFRLQP